MAVACTTGAPAIALATFRGGAAIGTPYLAARDSRRGCHHRADVRARCARDRPDAAARHARSLARSHPDRFRESGLCAVAAGRGVVRRCDYFPPIAGNLAIPAARFWACLLYTS